MECSGRRVVALILASVSLWSAAANADFERWRVLGPGTSGASTAPVRTLAIDPLTPSTIYAGISNAAISFSVPVPLEGRGIFKSTDAGASWTSSNGGLTNLLVTSLVIDPQTPSTLYAGTDGGGVFKSLDGGDSWTAISTDPTGLDVYSLAIDPATPATLYAGTEGGGIFKSTDSGSTWSSAGFPLAAVYSVAVHPQNQSILYAGTTRGIFKSTDGGVHWAVTAAMISRNVRGRPIRSFQFAYVVVLDPMNPSTVYAGMDDQGGVFKSTDAGVSWAAAWAGTESFGGVSRYITSLVVDPHDPLVLYAGTDQDAVFRTTNGGARWVPLDADSGHGIFSLAIDPQSPSKVYTGSFFSEVRQLERITMNLDRFKCYPVKAAVLPSQPVTLADEFQSTTATVAQAVSFCAPVNMSGQGILDLTANLTCYALTGAAAPPSPPMVIVENQLESVGYLPLPRPNTMCVPSQQIGAPSALNVDHFNCYGLTGSPDAWWFSLTSFDLTLSDQFASQESRFVRLESVCVPVDKNGEGVRDPAAHLTCYAISGRPLGIRPPRFRRRTISVRNEFGDQVLRLSKPTTLCVPSLLD